MSVASALRVDDPSGVGAARRLALAWCRTLDMNVERSGVAALAASELASNLVKHTGGAGGEILFRALGDGTNAGLELLALDRGPGIYSIAEALEDGRSTTGTAGTGLGAVRRTSSEFDIYAAPGLGTAVLSRIWQRPPAAGVLDAGVGAVSIPVAGEEVCGDAWTALVTPGRVRVLVADGLGHGPDASVAAERAVAAFREHPALSPACVLEQIHQALAGSRGAAVAITDADIRAGRVRFAGAGNISAALVHGDAVKNLVSHNGTAGVELPRVEEYAYDCHANAILIMHSDGVSSRWRLEDYPGLVRRAPSLTAGVLFRDHRRQRDDATVFVAQFGRER